MPLNLGDEPLKFTKFTTYYQGNVLLATSSLGSQTALSFSIIFVKIDFTNSTMPDLIRFRCLFAAVYGISLWINC